MYACWHHHYTSDRSLLSVKLPKYTLLFIHYSSAPIKAELRSMQTAWIIMFKYEMLQSDRIGSHRAAQGQKKKITIKARAPRTCHALLCFAHLFADLVAGRWSLVAGANTDSNVSHVCSTSTTSMASWNFFFE